MLHKSIIVVVILLLSSVLIVNAAKTRSRSTAASVISASRIPAKCKSFGNYNRRDIYNECTREFKNNNQGAFTCMVDRTCKVALKPTPNNYADMLRACINSVNKDTAANVQWQQLSMCVNNSKI